MRTTSSFSGAFRRAGLAIFAIALFLACAHYLSASLLKQEEVLQSDQAADILLERKIDDEGYLLTGHYSRFQFNHPGPFFFYVLHFVHRIADRFELAASISAYAATILLNGLFMLLAIFLAHRAIGQRAGILSVSASLVIVFSLIGHNVHALWMPYRIILPLTAYFFSLILVLRRELRYLPYACFFACVLVHGYLSMIVLALPLLFACALWSLRTTGFRPQPVEYRALAASGAICLMFVLPILVDLVINDPSNVSKIIAASMQEYRSPKFLQIIESVNQSAFGGMGLVQISILLAGGYALAVSAKTRSAWGCGLAVFFAMYLVFIVYHRFVPRPMYINMVLFMQGLPIALVLTALLGLFNFADNSLTRTRFLRHVVHVLLFLVTVVSVLQFRPVVLDANKNKYVRETASIIMLATFKQGHAVIEYTDHNQWISVAGVLLDLKLRNYKACTTREGTAFLYTPAQICRPEDKPNIRLTPVNKCGKECEFRAGKLGIMILE